MKLFKNILLSVLLLAGSIGYTQNIVNVGSKSIAVGSKLLSKADAPAFDYTSYGAEAVFLSFEIDTGTDARRSGTQKFVEQWLDLTTNNHDVSQGTEAKQPELILNYFGDKPSVRFDATDDILIRAEADFLSTSETGTVIIVAGYTPAFTELFTTSDEAGNVKSLNFGTQDNTGTDVLRIQRRNNDTPDRPVGSTDLSTIPVGIYTYESDGSSYTLEVNSNTESLTFQSGSNTGNWFADIPDRDNISIGALKRAVETHALADIGAVLVYPNKLSSTQKAAVRAALTADFQQSFSYDLYGLIGQSNARGGAPIGTIQAEYTTNDPNSDIQFWDGTRFGDLDILGGNYLFLKVGTDFGTVFSWGTDLVANKGSPQYIQMHALGGSALADDVGAVDDWNAANNELQFDFRVERSQIRIEAAANNITLNEKGVIWFHGVRDSQVEAFANAYQTNLNQLFDTLSIKLDVPRFLIVKTSIQLDIGDNPFRDTVRAAQQAVADARTDTEIITTDDLAVPGDHFDASSVEIIGERIFNVIKNW